ncbi:MAG TPA: hypothetical protein VM370_02545 [Candidatus Thermoplasmatota archaeon]|nr:hypothetical protein [Candidatus Thermoplasmatota archaeon]
MARRLLLLVLVIALAGCARPSGPPAVLTAPIAEGAPPQPTCAARCSHEWWNASIDGDEPFTLRLPVPAVWTGPQPFEGKDAWSWRGAPSVVGNATATPRETTQGPEVEIVGDGHVALRWSMARLAAEGQTADAFLRARWGGGEDDARPTTLVADATGAPRVELTYEARSDLCERRARFVSAEAPTAERLLLHGHDEASCG